MPHRPAVPVAIVRLLSLMAICLLLGAAPARAEGRHGGLACGGCHVAKDKVSLTTAPLLVTTQEQGCGSCHEGAVAAGHPVGFIPDRPLPADYPLDWRGRVTCSTCHDLHDDRPARLRGAKSGQELCLACHPASFFEEMKDRGRSLQASAHMNAVPGQHLGIDSYSSRCVDCHQGSVSLPNPDEATRGIPPRFGGLPNHPVGSDYIQVALQGGYQPLAGLPREMLLPEGRVSCLSCHQGYTREHGKLLRRGDKLCYECHIK